MHTTDAQAWAWQDPLARSLLATGMLPELKARVRAVTPADLAFLATGQLPGTDRDCSELDPKAVPVACCWHPTTAVLQARHCIGNKAAAVSLCSSWPD